MRRPIAKDRTHEKWAPPYQCFKSRRKIARNWNGASKRGTTAQRDCIRARIVLLRANGMKQEDVGREVGLSTTSVNKWSQRFARHGLEGLGDQSGRGRKSSIPIGENGTGGHTGRASAAGTPALEFAHNGSGGRHLGVERAAYLAPQRPQAPSARTFKLSNDKQFEEKFWDVIGLYLNPPDKALVLCCDEKTQCQALERTQPGLPLGIGHIRTHTHDYIRHGTITLFAALITSMARSSVEPRRSTPM